MMNTQTAKNLLLVVNSPDSNDALKAYAEYRIGELCHTLANMADYDEIARVQGQIRELKRILTLREEVIQRIKDYPDGD